MFDPLRRAWEALVRYPQLVVVPLGWEAVAYWSGWFLGVLPPSKSGLHIKFELPPTLPTAGELIGQSTAPGSGAIAPAHLAVSVALALLGALVAAGYLHLLTGALADLRPSPERFAEGVRRFGGRLLLWNLVVLLAIVAAVPLLMNLRALGVLVILLLLVGAIAFYLTEFLVVAEDLPLGEALAQAPRRLLAGLTPLMPVLLASVFVSVLISSVLTAAGLRTLLLASPLWAWFGTWVAMGVLAVIKESDSQNGA